MIYLKKFNEKLTEEQEESLKDFCDTCFAYLYDEGFNTSITTKLITPDRDTQFALANTFTANYKTNWDRYTGGTTPVRVYTIKLYGSCFEFNQISDSLFRFVDLLERNNVQLFKGLVFKGLAHYTYNTRTLDNIEEELYKVRGMYNNDQMTLTSISIDLLEYDLARAQIIN